MNTIDPDYTEHNSPKQLFDKFPTPGGADFRRGIVAASRHESSPYAPMSSANKKLYTDDRTKQSRHEEYEKLGKSIISQNAGEIQQQMESKASLPRIKDRDLLDSPNMMQTTTDSRVRVSDQPVTNFDAYSVRSNELFEEGKDDILFEGELYKFKPGLTVNFIPRYVQVSKRAFRYFKKKNDVYSGKPLVSIRKSVIQSALPYSVNKASYLKPGSAITKSHKEDVLFDNMFEIVLNQDYEDNYNYRAIEVKEKQKRDYETYE